MWLGEYLVKKYGFKGLKDVNQTLVVLDRARVKKSDRSAANRALGDIVKRSRSAS